MQDMLERFRKAQEPAIQRLLVLEKNMALPAVYTGERLAFSARLKQNGPGAVIAEYKRASPSKGVINLTAGPEEIAVMYAGCGASAISVLTEEAYFKGHISFIERMAFAALPILRKDFLVHPLQVVETAATAASALLLIVRMLDSNTLPAMLLKAQECGLEAVLEVFDSADLKRARSALHDTGVQPAIIQVNNRDLQTMQVDEAVSRRLVQERFGHEIWISASGINSRHDVEERAALGYDAVLAGTFLMESANPGEALARLSGKMSGGEA
jgi:indole-3-glycerol phosphate synthase